MSKTQIIKLEDLEKNQELEAIHKSIQQLKSTQEMIKEYKEREEELKNKLKQLDFNKIIFTKDDEIRIIFEITKYEQKRKQINEKKLMKELQVQGIKDVEKFLEGIKDEKISQAIRFNFK